MGFLLYPLTEGALEVWADLFQLSGEDVSTLVQIELGCIAAEEKVERQRLVLITNGACVEDYFLNLVLVFLDDLVIDFPAVGLDHIGEEDALELVDEQASADRFEQLEDRIPRIVGTRQRQIF